MTVNMKLYNILGHKPYIEFHWASPTKVRATLKPRCSEKYARVARSSFRSDMPH